MRISDWSSDGCSSDLLAHHSCACACASAMKRARAWDADAVVPLGADEPFQRAEASWPPLRSGRVTQMYEFAAHFKSNAESGADASGALFSLSSPTSPENGRAPCRERVCQSG